MKVVGLRGFIGAHGSDDNAVRGITGAAVLKAGTFNGQGKVPSVYEKKTDNLLNTIDNEIPPQLFGFLLSCNELRRTVVSKVAELGLIKSALVLGGYHRYRLLQSALTLTIKGICPSSRVNSLASPSLILYSKVAASFPL